MINMTSQINFTSKYKFISQQKLNQLLEEQKECRPITRVSNLGTGYTYVEDDSLAYTDCASSCVVYGLNNTKDDYGMLGHYNKYPTMILKNIQKYDVEGRGFMIGGRQDCIDTYYKTTLEEYDKKNLKTTVFYGQNYSPIGYTNVLFDRPNDTIYIAPLSEIHNTEDIKKYFSTIKVADGDEVYINDEKVQL